MIPAVNSEAAAPIAHATHGPLPIDLILHLDSRIFRSGHIRCEGNEQFAGNSLLHGNTSSWLLISVIAELRVYR